MKLLDGGKTIILESVWEDDIVYNFELFATAHYIFCMETKRILKSRFYQQGPAFDVGDT